jgi:hypothetical protein
MTTISEAEYRERIAALERQCATLAAQVDRMRPVVEAAVGVANDTSPGLAAGRWINLRSQVRTYSKAMAQLAKER